MKTKAIEQGAWLTVEDVAPLLGINPKLVYQMSLVSFPEERRIPCYRLGAKGGKLRFLREEILEYLTRLRPKPPASEPGTRALQILRPRKAERRTPRP